MSVHNSIIKQLQQFGYTKSEILDAMNHVNNGNDINQIIDYISIMASYGWSIAYTRDGKMYYQNNVTKQTAWLNPLTATHVSSNLPTEWGKCFTNDGKVYYQNNITKQTTWKRPTSSSSTRISLPKGWKQCVAPNGRIYYQNEITKRTQWTLPSTQQATTSGDNKHNIMNISDLLNIDNDEKRCNDTQREETESWKHKKIKKWSNKDIIEWIKSIGIPSKWRDIIVNEITNCGCTGKDIITLQSASDIGESFGITNTPKLCQEIYRKVQVMKTNPMDKKNAVNNENIFRINIFSHGRTFALNQKVHKGNTIDYIKRIYKTQCGVDANINDIHFYCRSKLLSPNQTLAQAQIVDAKHLISVKFGADGGQSGVPRCICGRMLSKMRIHSCYNGGSVSCDQCYEVLDRIQDEYVYHCTNKTNAMHPIGYDLCVECAEQ